MKILILASNYPSINNLYASPFIHSRCIEYKKHNHEVRVLSFLAVEKYTFDSILIFSVMNFDYKYNPDIVMTHAPDRDNHIEIINKHFSNKPLILFFHGHEIMNTNNHYPKPFIRNRKYEIKTRINDYFKLSFLRKFLVKRLEQKNTHIIFVSEWMKKTAFFDLKLSNKNISLFNLNSSVIENSSNTIFLDSSFQEITKKNADFITIRPFDRPKYAIDVVYKIAKDNPQYTFHVYGKGVFFDSKPTLANLKVFKKFIEQKQIPQLLNMYKYALMPTRLDSQGVMMCEIACYGMPLITSNIPICHEMLEGYNVAYIENNKEIVQNLTQLITKLNLHDTKNKNKNFNASHLVTRELEIATRMAII